MKMTDTSVYICKICCMTPCKALQRWIPDMTALSVYKCICKTSYKIYEVNAKFQQKLIWYDNV